LRLLLWLYEEEEPSIYRYERDLRLIDKDLSGEVTRKEFFLYLCSKDQ